MIENTENPPIETNQQEPQKPDNSQPELIPISEQTTNPEIIPVTVEQLIDRTEKRGRGRPKGSTNKKPPENGVSVLPEQPGQIPPKPPEPENIPQVNYALLSETFFDTGTGAMALAFGPEWHPRTPEERGAVCNALAKYLQAKEVKDIPPGAMLTIVLLAYSAPRLKEPATSGKIKMGLMWVKNKLSGKILK